MFTEQYIPKVQLSLRVRRKQSDVILADFDLLRSVFIARLIVWRQLWRERMNRLARRPGWTQLNPERTSNSRNGCREQFSAVVGRLVIEGSQSPQKTRSKTPIATNSNSQPAGKPASTS